MARASSGRQRAVVASGAFGMSGVSGVSGVMGRSTAGRSSATRIRRRGYGAATARALAVAHVAAGAIWAALAGMGGYFAASAQPHLVALGALGVWVALGGGIAWQLIRLGGPKRPWTIAAARVALPLVELVAAVGALWLVGGAGAALALLVPPALLAALLLGWWIGGVVALVGTLLAALALMAQPGAQPGEWVAGIAALALAQGLVIAAATCVTGRIQRAYAELAARYAASQRAREEDAAERQRLRDGLRLLEETHLRLEHERAQLDHQAVELAHILRRMLAGDSRVAQSLLAHMSSGGALAGHALGELAAALGQLMRQEHTTGHLRARQAQQQRQAGALNGALAEQAQLVRTTDAALRDQAGVANQLVAEIQWLVRENQQQAGPLGGEQSPVGRRLRRLEQLALGHASGTAMLGARTAQLRAGHEQLAARVRDLAGRAEPTPREGLGSVSGVFTPETVVAVGARSRG